MKMIRKFLVAFGFALGISANAHAGIPVIDVANLASAIEQVVAWGTQYGQMIEQIESMKQQYETAKNQFESLNGTRGIADLLRNETGLYNYLPDDVVAKLSNVQQGGLPGSDAMLETLKVYSLQEAGIDPNSSAGKLFTGRQRANANFKVLGEQGYSAMTERINQLKSLTESINGTEDPKAIAELQARINAEQGFIQNEQAKLQVLAQMQASQDDIAAQQARETLMKSSSGDVARF